MDQIIAGTHHDPHAVLGAHPDGTGTTIRTLRRGADQVLLVVGDRRVPMDRVHAEGVFEVTVPGEVLDYRVEVGGVGYDDPYRYPPTVGEFDLHLIREGRHERLWTVLGAHVRDGGVSFAVWAPNARGVRLMGDPAHWGEQGGWGIHEGWPMRSLGSSGVWELFVPGATAGQAYKYRILGADSTWRDKADPVAALAETPPKTASVVYDSRYEWGDADWMAARAQRRPHESPVSIYEVHLGSWRPGKSYRDLAEELTAYVSEMGFTHVEFLPVMEHPFGGSWGYQVSGYYAPTSRYGNPDDFRYLVDRLHRAGIGVLLDWVPAHFPRDDFALARFDGTPLYEHGDPQRGEHPDWGTYVFDFGRSEVRNFLVANALYWLSEFHVDGLRVDAVASMLYLDYSRKAGEWSPNRYGGRENLDAISFLQECTATAYKLNPGIMMIAEESTAFPGVTHSTDGHGLGFGFKWNMGWMHDTLEYISRDPIYRRWHHNEITFSLAYAWSENYLLPISHDEVVHGKRSLAAKMPGDTWQRLANVRALASWMWSHPGKQLLFMGCELADDREWSEQNGLDWGLLQDPARAGVQRLIRDLNALYRSEPALWTQDTTPAGFQWITVDDQANSILAYLRVGTGGEQLACIVNFTPTPQDVYRIGLPHTGAWTEVLNTDADVYGGSNVGNMGTVHAEPLPYSGYPASAVMRVPPLGAIWLRPATS